MTELIIRYAEPSAVMDRAVIPSEVVGTLVRCKDCKNGKYELVDNKGWIYCKHHFDYWVADDFCSYGERGEE